MGTAASKVLISLVRLSMPDWQYTEYDDSWGFLCDPCGLKISERLNNSGN